MLSDVDPSINDKDPACGCHHCVSTHLVTPTMRLDESLKARGSSGSEISLHNNDICVEMSGDLA